MRVMFPGCPAEPGSTKESYVGHLVLVRAALADVHVAARFQMVSPQRPVRNLESKDELALCSCRIWSCSLCQS